MPNALALLRGINVGRAKRVAMADLRALLEGLGFSEVRTLLNSGNAVFTVPAGHRGELAAQIERALASRLHVTARVFVFSAADLHQIVAGMPFPQFAENPSRAMVTFIPNPADLAKLRPLLKEDWSPEALALGDRAAYAWFPNSVLESPLNTALARLLKDGGTARNWATVLKLAALVDGR
ncbi:MAG TPA: DUF1697 domain-containing protein [Chthoniobacteraceae bacterium]|jgi:uncharacterized protein (DUF1697 family)|nr:DUF1697 domain-containing protein [Chthoniobacteraceae bacterium]